MTPTASSGVRFAPSPTGRFHLGNLRTAWISSELARALEEPLIVRFEDIDRQRIVVGAQQHQLNDLRQIGIFPNSIVQQSSRLVRHIELFVRAQAEGRIYACDCSRKDVVETLAQIERAPHAAPHEYSGRCRQRSEPIEDQKIIGWRWKLSDITGKNDPIIARSDAAAKFFTPSYHWACAIDDSDGNYRILVRSWDLAAANIIQREIRQWLVPNHRGPIVFHTSLVTRTDGGRLEKRSEGVKLEEILSNGMTPNRLLENFQSGFDVLDALEKMALAESMESEIEIGENDRELSVGKLTI